jgi:gluconokinase
LSLSSAAGYIVSPQEIEVPLVLTLDIGSSSVRALLFDRIGRAVEGSATSEAYRLETPVPGAAEIDPGMLLELAFRCIDGVLVQSGPLAAQIETVAISTLVPNILGVADDWQPTTPIYTYADTRALTPT